MEEQNGPPTLEAIVAGKLPTSRGVALNESNNKGVVQG